MMAHIECWHGSFVIIQGIGINIAKKTSSPWMKITLYRIETHVGGYRDWYRPIVPYLKI